MFFIFGGKHYRTSDEHHLQTMHPNDMKQE